MRRAVRANGFFDDGINTRRRDVAPMSVAVTLAALVVVAVVAVGVVKYWVPGGRLAPTIRWHAYTSGLSPRVGVGAAVLVAVGLGGPMLVFGADRIGLGWALAGGGYLGGVVVGAVALSNWPRYRQFDDATSTAADDVVDGLVVVSGTARPADNLLTTPFTGTDALCHGYAVAEYASVPNRNRGGWYVTAFGIERTPFYVADETGRVLVDPSNAWLSLAPGNSPTTTRRDVAGAFTGGSAERSIAVDAGDEPPRRVREFYASRDGDDSPLAEDGTVPRDTRFKEFGLEPGEDVVVVGTADRRADAHEPVVRGADGTSTFVTNGSVEAVRAGFEQTVVRNAKIAAVLVVLGGVGVVGLPLL
jgi:hypothetical protein